MRPILHRLLWNHPGHAWVPPIRWVDRRGHVQDWSHRLASWFCDRVWCDYTPAPTKPMTQTFTINNTATARSLTFTSGGR